MPPSTLYLLTAILAIALVSAAAGVRLGDNPFLLRRTVPFSGGVLVGISVFWLFPELASQLGWGAAAFVMIFSFLGLALVDRYIYPVCPACAPGHDHHACRTRLHGFGIPLISAAVLHSFLDGWGIGATEQHQAFGLAIFAGIAFHKVPEALAFGIILRAALPRPATAMAWAGLVQFSMVAGGWAGFGMAPMLGVYWLHVLLGVAGGTFLYLGLHAVHGEWRRRGMPAFGPALTGAAGAAALQHGLRVLFR